MTVEEILYLAGAAAVGVSLVFVMRWRRTSHAAHLHQLAQDEVCEHLRPALLALLARGHVVRRVGQRDPDAPLEIHLTPPFDPKAVADEVKLEEPALLSERNVLYCKEDWCEIHPAA